MDAKVTWHAKLSFTGTSDSGFSLPLGTASTVGDDGDGFQPMELFAIGLAGCTAMDVISILAKKRQDVTAFDVQVHVERAREHPKVFISAEIEYLVSGHQVNENAVLRAIELSTTRYCPAQAMLGKVIPIGLKYSIYEDEGDERQTLVKSGVYSPAKEQA